MIRDDLSNKLIHLTRGEWDDAANKFLSILQEKKLKGGTGCIKGAFRCVCFSEAPVAKLSHILANPSVSGFRYKPFGIMVSKEWLYSRGGRPVIYQPDSEFELLHESHKFRHVRYEPKNNIDYTWEREWRIQKDEIALEPNETTVVVPTREWEEWFQSQHTSNLGRRALLTRGFMGPSNQPWHFVVLEDLGVSMPDDVQPPPPKESIL